jgi:hypothetical protein
MPSEISAASHVNNEKEMSMEASKVMEEVSMQAMKMKAVSNGFRRLVLGLLYTDGPMYQSDILKHVDIKSNLLAYHLAILASADMVEQRYSEREGQKFSLYSIKEEGRKFLKQIGARTRLDAIKNDDGSSLSKRIKRRYPDTSGYIKKSSRLPPNRPPNKRCIKCGRKSIAPETTRRGGEWKFRGIQICTNCFMLMNDYIYAISTGKRRLKIKSVKESREAFPLIILDRSNNEYVGKFDNPKDLKKKLNSYRTEHPKSNIQIIDTKYHDYTADVLGVPDWQDKANV